MGFSRRNKRRSIIRRVAWGAFLAALTLLTAVLAYYTLEVRRHAQRQETVPADAIVVMGAAEYRGHPSPVLRARLDHALALWRQGLARYIVTTGGAGGDPDFTEAEVGRAYLISKGVPAEVILVEPEGDSTVHSAAAAAEIMARKRLHSCLLVSDGYHIFRARRLLEARGITVYGAPRPSENPPKSWQQWWLCLRQAVGYTLWSAGISL